MKDAEDFFCGLLQVCALLNPVFGPWSQLFDLQSSSTDERKQDLKKNKKLTFGQN